MPGWPIRKNEAGTLPVLVFPIYDADGDLVSAAAGLDSERSIDQATFADTTNEASEIATGSGIYSLAPTQAELNGDEVAFITKTSTGGAKTAVNVLYTSTRNLDDLAFPTVSGRSLDVAATGEAGVDFNNILGTLDAAEIGTDAITADKIAANAIGSSELATDAIGAAELATDAVREIQGVYANGTSDAGGSTTTLVDAALTESDDVHIGNWVRFTSGAVMNQVRLVTEFVAASDTITFAPAVTASIGAGFTYELIERAAGVDVQSWLGLVTGLVAPNALVSGAVDADVSAIQAGAITAAAIANGAIDAATFAAGAIDDAAIAADAFDGMFIRDIDQVEASAPVHSITSAILKAVGRIRDNAGTLETYRTNGTTIHMSQTVTVDNTLDPVDELTGGV